MVFFSRASGLCLGRKRDAETSVLSACFSWEYSCCWFRASAPQAAARVAPLRRQGALDDDFDHEAALTSPSLVDMYTVRDKLGEGSFGVVHECTSNLSGKVFAVKFVDRVDSCPDNINSEHEVLRKLNHRNIVPVIDVFVEPCFLCIVLPKYCGGNLIRASHQYMQNSGLLNVRLVRHISYQMVAAIDYLHSLDIVHRDVKGDNFMLDQNDMTSRSCGVILVDFGTAVAIEHGQRLTERVGTWLYCSPEALDKSYGKKVDVWALGVTHGGLATCKFLFKDENSIRNVDPTFTSGEPQVYRNFLLLMLAKDEESRADAATLTLHSWLNTVLATGSFLKKTQPEGVDSPELDRPRLDTADTSPSPVAPEVSPEDALVMTPSGPNVVVKERRQELVHRMRSRPGHGPRLSVSGINANVGIASFLSSRSSLGAMNSVNRVPQCRSPDGSWVFTWEHFNQVSAMGLDNAFLKAKYDSKVCSTSFSTDLASLSKLLEDHGVDVTSFGKDNSRNLESLAEEIDRGDCRLLLDASAHRSIVRVKDVVVLRLTTRKDGLWYVLYQIGEQSESGAYNSMEKRLPGTTRQAHENAGPSMRRFLASMELSCDLDIIQLNLDDVMRSEGVQPSLAYPGLETVYRKECVEGILNTTDPELLATFGLPCLDIWTAAGAHGPRLLLAWIEVPMKAHQFAPSRASVLVHPPALTDVSRITELYSKAKITPEQFQGLDVSLEDVTSEALRGTAQLSVDADGILVRMVIIVHVLVTNRDDMMLVQTHQVSADGDLEEMYQWPSGRGRLDISYFSAARQILRDKLGINASAVIFEKNVKVSEEVQEAQTSPNMITVNRSVFVSAQFLESTDELRSERFLSASQSMSSSLGGSSVYTFDM